MAQEAANSNPPSPPVLMKKPPNVNFDPKSKSSPFFGLKPLPKEVVLSSRTEEVEPDEDNDEDDYTEDVDDDQWFDVSERLKAMNVPAIPLPERLHVSVLDKNDGTIVGSIYLNPIVFGQGNIRVDILHRVVQYQRAKKTRKAEAFDENHFDTKWIRKEGTTPKGRWNCESRTFASASLEGWSEGAWTQGSHSRLHTKVK